MLKTIIHLEEKLQLLYDHIKTLDDNLELLNNRVKKIERLLNKKKTL
jgi:hypothetical protein